MRLRSQLALSGALGVVGAAALMGAALFLLRRLGPNLLLSGPGAWLVLGFLLLFSLAEIPVMIFGMRHMLGTDSGERLALLTNAAFTFFAGVYAAPFLVLTGRTAIGLGMAGLALLRWGVALWLVPGGSRAMTNSVQRPISNNLHSPSPREEI